MGLWGMVLHRTTLRLPHPSPLLRQCSWIAAGSACRLSYDCQSQWLLIPQWLSPRSTPKSAFRVFPSSSAMWPLRWGTHQFHIASPLLCPLHKVQQKVLMTRALFSDVMVFADLINWSMCRWQRSQLKAPRPTQYAQEASVLNVGMLSLHHWFLDLNRVYLLGTVS